ncbi:hypothetical protein Btru_002569 [Bulinus truncatus]|nr:hypothetical protein Btru_002569 [Bulinus truncatus]
MTGSLRTVTLFLAVFTAFIPEPCRTYISLGVDNNNCPRVQRDECDRMLKSDLQYVNVYSKRFDSNFLCDTKTDGGGWIVIQRRTNKDTDFTRNWEKYKKGFGPICSDYWLGNGYIQRITSSGLFELRIDMLYDQNKYYATYKEFYIDNERKNYTLHISGFEGNTKDNLAGHNDKPFSTPDKDNDVSGRHCAKEYGAGWWYSDCHHSNLNGMFNATKTYGKSVTWESVSGEYDTLAAVEMKIRERNFQVHTNK